MQIPVASTITLIMELVIGFLVFFILFRGYRKNDFRKRLALFALVYETVFNVGYMIYRTVARPSMANLSDLMKVVAAMHGMLSLAMLVAVVALFLRAGREYARGVNSFAFHKTQTRLFAILWTISLVSGIFLYLRIYVV